MKDSVRAYIQRSIGEQPVICLDDLEAYRDLVNRCPENLRHIFREKRIPQAIKRCFQTPVAPNFAVHEPERECGSRVGTTYMTDSFVLSSMNMEDCWEQRRHVFAYFGDTKNPAYLRLRVLHDGRDFSSAICSAVQDEGSILGAVGLVTDNGDSHTHLDPINNATIDATDFRIRLEIGGNFDNSIWKHNRNQLTFKQSGLEMSFAYHAQAEADWQIVSSEGGIIAFDLIYYLGESQAVNLKSLNASTVGFSLSMHESDSAESHLVDITSNDSRIEFNWPQRELTLSAIADTSLWKNWAELT
jgi:hypothetical protein